MKISPKQKAKELVDRYPSAKLKEAKIKAIHEIDDIIHEYKLEEKSEDVYSFWQKVKKEIEQL